MATAVSAGPLAGVKVVEFGGIGPLPFCGMLLADMGADIVRIEPPGGDPWPNPVTARGKICVSLDLKNREVVADCLDLLIDSDVLIEGFRPGVMERLGLGPDVVMRSNPRLIYGRMTGWGQDGPLAKYAGHDIDYIALTGVLAAMGPAPGIPVPPLNVVGDYGGGALYLAMGIAAALFARAHTGRGQMIDAAIIDGASSLLATAMGYCATGQLSWVRGANMLDGSCPYYRCYVCADGKHIAVGAVEPLFYTNLLEKIGVDTEALGPRDDVSRWPAACDILGTLFRTRTRDAWCSLFAETDACVAPVLALHEAPEHGQMRARRVHIEVDGITQPAPAPRFSVDSLALPRGAARVGDLAELRALRRAGGLG